MADPGDVRTSLPIACTLGPTDGAERLRQWRELLAASGAGRSASSGRVVLRLRDDPGVGPELTRLVAAERECCAFLDWRLVQDEGEWRVEITGDVQSLSTILSS